MQQDVGRQLHRIVPAEIFEIEERQTRRRGGASGCGSRNRRARGCGARARARGRRTPVLRGARVGARVTSLVQRRRNVRRQEGPQRAWLAFEGEQLPNSRAESAAQSRPRTGRPPRPDAKEGAPRNGATRGARRGRRAPDRCLRPRPRRHLGPRSRSAGRSCCRAIDGDDPRGRGEAVLRHPSQRADLGAEPSRGSSSSEGYCLSAKAPRRRRRPDRRGCCARRRPLQSIDRSADQAARDALSASPRESFIRTKIVSSIGGPVRTDRVRAAIAAVRTFARTGFARRLPENRDRREPPRGRRRICRIQSPRCAAAFRRACPQRRRVATRPADPVVEEAFAPPSSRARPRAD